MNFKRLWVILAFGLIIPCVQAQYSFLETDGKVAMEAEYFTSTKGGWEEVEGRNAYPYEKQGFGLEWTGKHIIIKDNTLFPTISKGEIALGEKGFSMSFGKPGKEAKILAKYPKYNDLTSIFYYDKGAQLPKGKAAEKRLCQHFAFDRLNKQGRAICKGTMMWLADNDTEKVVYFVGKAFEKDEGTDIEQIAWLKELGFTVKAFYPKEATNKVLSEADVIILSESMREEELEHGVMQLPVPMMISQSSKWGEMGLTTGQPQWTPNTGEVGNAMLIRYGTYDDHLQYAVYFENPGEYDLWLLGRNKGEGIDKIAVFIDAPSLKKGKEATAIGLAQTTEWYKGDRKIKISKKGWVNLKIASGDLPEGKFRYPNYRIDKIYLTKNGDRPQGDGTPQQLNQTKDLPSEMVSNEAFLPKQVWEIKEGIVVMEAEEIDHHSNWELKTDIEGYSGKGYLEWRGPGRSKSIEGYGGNWDKYFVKQGPQQEWLILSIKVDQPGMYYINQKNHHKKVDGDNDTWLYMVDARTYHEDVFEPVVKRQGDSLRDGNLSWLDWGVRAFELKKGINHIYIGGRSNGWGIDQIAVYSDAVSAEKLNAIGIKTSDN